MTSKVRVERLGINAVEKFFIDAGWFFREQPVIDWGVDAYVEVAEGGVPSGRLIGLQIKSGLSFFRRKGDDFVFYGKKRHLEYWSNHSLPCFLILYNPDDGMMLWCRLERRLITVTDKGWSIVIPRDQILDKSSLRNLSESIGNDPESKRRARLALDFGLIEALAKEPEVYLTVPIWVNKSLNFRGATITLGELSKKEADFKIEYLAAGASVQLVMENILPWLDYEYAESVEEVSGEIEVHKLSVKVNELGHAVLAVENFARHGSHDQEHPEAEYGREDDFDDEAWMELMWRHALERDD